jgi:HPr kinase/phosphorylase
MTDHSGVLVHATSVVLGASARAFDGPEDAAVLLLGDSGSGKSDLALRLIAAGAQLLADDQTLLTVEHGKLCGEAPAPIKGLMEIRGVGIIALQPAKRAPIVLAVQLRPGDGERLPEPASYAPPLPLRPDALPPLIHLDPFVLSAPARIAAAASAAAMGRFVAGAAESHVL